MSVFARPARGLVGALGLASSLFLPASAWASWAQGRDNPSARDIAVVDATGEPSWPYGAEDIAADGVTMFSGAEQSRDVRTLYATSDGTRFWARLYVSDDSMVASDLTAFVFIDADRNVQTGGRANSPGLDATLPADPTTGGYDRVVVFRGDGTNIRLLQWDAVTRTFLAQNLNGNDSGGEVGNAVDPLLLGVRQHGYVQVWLRSLLLDIPDLCNVNLFARTLNTTGAPGGEDVNIGERVSCIPRDGNSDRVPDVVVVPGCDSDAECPLSGICVARRCVIPPPCTSDADCAADAQCSANGWCVARPTDRACTADTNCGDLVCENSRCSPCSASDCRDGYRCAPSGRCVPESGGTAPPVALDPDENVEGGALHCGLPQPSSSSSLPMLFVAAALALLRRTRRAQRRK
ncbi:MAG: hypothetical protein ACOY0T_28080 [Myxococcota bacterium]